MSIRRQSTPPMISGDDLQFTHRGREFGVEITDIGDMRFIFLVERVGGTWSAQVSPPFEGCTDADITTAGGPAMWIKSVFVPELNKWLSALFQPAAATPAGLIDQVDALLPQMVAFAPQSDGTIKAVLK